MAIKKIILAVNTLLRAKILRRRIPFAVSWALTYRCNSRCLYCQIWNIDSKELSTKEILSILDELVAMGMHWVSFTGGEPLLREDIGEIVDYASKKSIHTSISSNGVLVKEKISQIRNINRISLSFDGPAELHDFLRGSGSHCKVIESIKVARSNNIQTVLNTVLSKYNLSHIDYILNIAEQFKSKAFFQPATYYILGGSILDPAAPPEKDYKQAIIKLITKKKEGNNNISNSIIGLKHLYHWPSPKKIPCSAGRVHFRIEPNGWVNTCNRLFLNKHEESQDAMKLGIKKAVCRLKPSSCSLCWCAPLVEFNFAVSLNPSAIINILNRV